jgi:hypothetical protein
MKFNISSFYYCVLALFESNETGNLPRVDLNLTPPPTKRRVFVIESFALNWITTRRLRASTETIT